MRPVSPPLLPLPHSVLTLPFPPVSSPAQSPMRKYNNAKGDGQLFSVDLLDESGEGGEGEGREARSRGWCGMHG